MRWVNSLIVGLCLSSAALLPGVVVAADTAPATAPPTATPAPAVTPAPATPPPAAAPFAKPGSVPVDVTVAFPQDYQTWTTWVAQNPRRRPTDGQEFHALSELGVQAVPLMIAKMQQNPDEAYPLARAVEHITQKVFPADAYPAGKNGDLHEAAKLYIAWWTTGRKDTAAAFEKLYTDWKAAKKDGDNVISMDEVIYDSVNMTVMVHKNSQTPFGEAYYGIKNLGLDVLPLIVAQVQANDCNLLPLISEMTGGRAHFEGTPDKRAKGLLKWWDKNQAQWTLPAAQ